MGWLRVKGDPGCTKCGLHETAQSVCLMGRGKKIPCDVMFVGEAPGYREDDINKPFQGQAGEVLDDVIEEFGWTRDNFYLTNTVKCRPPDNRIPRVREITECRSWFEKELRLVKPKFVLLLGRVAMGILPELKRKKITELHGQIFEKDGVYYMPTFHPASCLPGRDRRGFNMRMLKIDIRSFIRLCETGAPTESEELNVKVVQTMDDFNEMLEDLSRTDILSHDVETTSLRPWSNKDLNEIVLVGFGTEKTQWVLPWYCDHTKYRKREVFPGQKSKQMAAELIHQAIQGKEIVTQFGKFDTSWWLAKHDLNIDIGFDTGIAHIVLDENSPHELKYLASLYFGADSYDVSTEEKQGYGISLKRHSIYLGKDLYYTRKLRFLLSDLLAKDRRLDRYYRELFGKAYNEYRHIEQNGLWLSKKFGKAQAFAHDSISSAIGKLNTIQKPGPIRRKAKRYSGWYSSTKQISKLLYGELNFPILQETKKGGAPSTAEAVLKKLSVPPKDPERIVRKEIAQVATHNPRVWIPGQEIVWWEGYKHEIPGLILNFREAKKQCEFVDSWEGNQVNGIVHPNFKFMTVTGRPSCEKPNLQQVPRNKTLRCSFGAPKGWTFVEADYSQIELRFVAMASRDRRMMEIYRTGGDIHLMTAQWILQKQKILEEERKRAKAVNFGFVYGMYPRKFVATAWDKYGLVFTEDEAGDIRESYFNLYADLEDWHESQRQKVRKFGYVRDIFGRIRHLPAIYSDDKMERMEAERQAINSPIQGGASNLTLCAVIEIQSTFPRSVARVGSTVHDAILMRVRNEHVHEVMLSVKSIMEAPKIAKNLGVEFTVPIIADFKVGNWGIGKELNPKKFKSQDHLNEFLGAT